MTFCNNCGTNLEEDIKFCTGCETPIKHSNKNKEVGESFESKNA